MIAYRRSRSFFPFSKDFSQCIFLLETHPPARG